MLMAINEYETALTYYKKLSELSSKVKIDRKYLNDSNYYSLRDEISHAQYYINSPIENYPPKLKLEKLTPGERRNFENNIYPLPTEGIPGNPLVSEGQAKKIAVEALKQVLNRYFGTAVEQVRPPTPEELGRTREQDSAIGNIELSVQPQIISFDSTGSNLSMDLFDPFYDFVEYRLMWLATNESQRYLVKIDAITGEVLSTQYIGPIE